jgi:hypothetical protein
VFALSVLSKPLSGSEFVAKTYTPTTPPITSVGPSSLFFPYPGSSNQSLEVHETNYHDAFSTVGLCQMVGATIANTTATSVYPSPNVANQDSGPATFTFVPVQAGICSQIVQDVYGTTATLPVQVAGPLLVTPTTLGMSLHANPASGYPSNTATITGTKTWSYTPLVLTLSNCPIVTATQTETDTPTFSATPAGGVLTVTATATGSCTATVSDQFGETQAVSIVVYDDPVYDLLNSPTSGSLTRGTSMGVEATAGVAALASGHSYYPGTASSLTVDVAGVSYTGTAGGCSAGPSGWEPTGYVFTVTDSDPVGGVCTVSFGANTASANNPYASVTPATVTTTITFGAQAVQQYSVCNVAGNPNYYSGSYAVNYSANPPTQAVGTSAIPPCAAPTATPTCAPPSTGTYPDCSKNPVLQPTQVSYTFIEPTHGALCAEVSDTSEISDALVYVFTGSPPAPGVIFDGYNSSGTYVSGPASWLDYKTTITATDGCSPGVGKDPGGPKNGKVTTTYTISMNSTLTEDATAYCALAGCSMSTATDQYNAAIAALQYYSSNTAPSGYQYVYAGLGEAVPTYTVPPADIVTDCGEEILPGGISLTSGCG